MVLSEKVDCDDDGFVFFQNAPPEAIPERVALALVVCGGVESAASRGGFGLIPVQRGRLGLRLGGFLGRGGADGEDQG
jgi:hypothetical protein